MHNLQEHN